MTHRLSVLIPTKFFIVLPVVNKSHKEEMSVSNGAHCTAEVCLTKPTKMCLNRKQLKLSVVFWQKQIANIYSSIWLNVRKKEIFFTII